MGTTTKMAIPYPEATGLVKDGWEDMKDIATQVDAKSGLVLLSTTSFTAQSAVNFSNFTTASYTHYRVLLSLYGSTGLNVNFRFRENVTDKATDYYGAGWYYRAASTSGINAARNNGTEAVIGATTTATNYLTADFVFSKPVATRGQIIGVSFDSNSNGGNNFAYTGVSMTDVTGFSLIASTGNITGKASIYGINE